MLRFLKVYAALLFVRVFSFFEALLGFLSAEFLLRWWTNSGTVLLVRTLWVSLLLYFPAIGLKSYLAESSILDFDGVQFQQEVSETIHWFGAIFAAVYAAMQTLGRVTIPPDDHASTECLPIPPPANDDLGTATDRKAVPKFFLRMVAGDMRDFGLTDTTYVGRAPGCQLRLEHNSISRRHARLFPISEGVLVEDLGSANGTYINNKRVQRAFAKAGDEIGFDTVRFQLCEVGEDGANGSGSVVGQMPRWIWRALAVVVIGAVALYILL